MLLLLLAAQYSALILGKREEDSIKNQLKNLTKKYRKQLWKHRVQKIRYRPKYTYILFTFLYLWISLLNGWGVNSFA